MRTEIIVLIFAALLYIAIILCIPMIDKAQAETERYWHGEFTADNQTFELIRL